jgi:acyl dehydratase
MIRYNNKKYDPENPVLNDAAYAKKLGYENIFGMPTFAANDDNILKAYPAEARDKLLVSDLNHSITYYKPIYPGDTLYTVINKRSFVDGTPKEGSIFRAVCMQTEASIYNQKGEKVNDCIFRVTENIGILKEGAANVSGGMNPAWVGPDWKSRPMHVYTDADWKYIRELWSKEKRQDGTPLYWEDVKVGDEPAWTVDGPIMATANPTQPYGQGVGGSRTLKKEIMDPAIFKTMIKDENGIWLTANKDYIPAIPSTGSQGGRGGAPPGGAPQGGAPGAQGGAPAGAPQGGAPAGSGPASDIDTKEIHKQVGSERAVLINYVGRDIAIRHVDNWMGDKGWIYNIRWSIMAPSALASVGLKVAANPFSERFVDQVPKLKAANKVVNAHGLTYELAIVKSYVAKKYQKGNEYFVDLIWWIENLDGYIWEEGGATVKLPSKNAK